MTVYHLCLVLAFLLLAVLLVYLHDRRSTRLQRLFHRARETTLKNKDLSLDNARLIRLFRAQGNTDHLRRLERWTWETWGQPLPVEAVETSPTRPSLLARIRAFLLRPVKREEPEER